MIERESPKWICCHTMRWLCTPSEAVTWSVNLSVYKPTLEKRPHGHSVTRSVTKLNITDLNIPVIHHFNMYNLVMLPLVDSSLATPSLRLSAFTWTCVAAEQTYPPYFCYLSSTPFCLKLRCSVASSWVSISLLPRMVIRWLFCLTTSRLLWW